MRQKLISIVLNPIFIALVISLVIIYFLPDYFSKYEIELVDKSLINRPHRIYFEDLNNDNYSEKIIFYHNALGNASFEIHSSKGHLIDQYNFPAEHSSPLKNLSFFDADNNGFKEIYLITQNRDSLFLNIEEPFVKNGIHKKNILIEIINEHNKKFNVGSKIFGAYAGNSNGIKDVFFVLSRGFSGNPRSVYKYNIAEDQIYKSPHLTNPSSISHIIDLDNDGSKEILIRNYSACNKIDSSNTKRSDYSSWFTVLSEDLNFRFDPIEFKIPYSGVNTIPYKNNNSDFQLLCLLNSKQEDLSPDKLIIFTSSGKSLNEKLLPSGNYKVFSESNKDAFILLNYDNGHIQTYNFDLKELTSIFIEPKSMIYPLDIDGNGKTEWLVKSKSQNKIKIYQNNFEDPIEFQIPGNTDDKLTYGLIKIGEKENGIYFQKGKNHYVYKYSENPLYFLRYLIYVGIFLIVLGLVWLIMKGQKIRMEGPGRRASRLVVEPNLAYVVGADLEGTAIRSCVLNCAREPLAYDRRNIDTSWSVERILSEWAELIHSTIKKSGVDPADIAGIGLDRKSVV